MINSRNGCLSAALCGGDEVGAVTVHIVFTVLHSSFFGTDAISQKLLQPMCNLVGFNSVCKKDVHHTLVYTLIFATLIFTTLVLANRSKPRVVQLGSTEICNQICHYICQ